MRQVSPKEKDADKGFIMDLTSKMKVSDLRTALSARGFDTRGLKSELVGRLNAALDGEADEAEDCNEVEVVAVAQADRKQKSPKMNKAKGGDIFLTSGNPENLKKVSVNYLYSRRVRDTILKLNATHTY